MISQFNNLEKESRTPTTKRLYNEMNSSSSSNDQTPKRLMKFAYNNICYLVKELAGCHNYTNNVLKVGIDNINEILNVEREETKKKLENKESKLISGNYNMNMNDLKNKLFSEICVMHEKKVNEEHVVEKIMNIYLFI